MYKKCIVILFLCLCTTVYGDSSLSMGLRLNPSYYMPFNSEYLNSGFGISGSFDIYPVPFLDIFVQGEYVDLTPKGLETVAIINGSIGAGFLWRPIDRAKFRIDLTAGIYSISSASSDTDATGYSLGTRLSGEYVLSPMYSLVAHGGFQHYAGSPNTVANVFSAGAGVNINLSEAFFKATRLDIKKINQNPVFPVFYSWYDENPFARVEIKNNEPNDIKNIRVSFFMEQYMAVPKLSASIPKLKKGETLEVGMKAFFNESMLALTENVNANARVIVEYTTLGSKRVTETTIDVLVWHRNAMSWADDRQAAAFVSARDPGALWFSRYVASMVQNNLRHGINRNLQYALGVFESLGRFGLNYVIDPSSAYVDNIGTDSIDFLQFPYQTLMFRGGDCDDISILFCSLLEAVNIETAFVTIPGHIYMAFSLGITKEEALASYFDPASLVFHEGMAWLPLEITLTKEKFMRAWLIGAKEWNDAAVSGDAKLFPMKDSWGIFPPISVPSATASFNLPKDEVLISAFNSSIDTVISQQIRPFIREYEQQLVEADTPETRNLFGVLYGNFGILDKAEEQFQNAALNGSVPALVNLGNSAFIKQNYVNAISFYNEVLTEEPRNYDALLGLARCYYEYDDFSKSDKFYADLKRVNPEIARKYSYLSSFFNVKGRAWSFSERLLSIEWSTEKEQELIVEENIIEEIVELVDAEVPKPVEIEGNIGIQPALIPEPLEVPKPVEIEEDVAETEVEIAEVEAETEIAEVEEDISGGLTAMLGGISNLDEKFASDITIAIPPALIPDPIEVPKPEEIEVVIVPEPAPVEVAIVSVLEPVEVAIVPVLEPVEVAIAPVLEPVEVVIEPEPVEVAIAPEPVEAVIAPEPVETSLLKSFGLTIITIFGIGIAFIASVIYLIRKRKK